MEPPLIAVERLAVSGHQQALPNSRWASASDGQQPFGWRGSGAVTGVLQTVSCAAQRSQERTHSLTYLLLGSAASAPMVLGWRLQ